MDTQAGFTNPLRDFYAPQPTAQVPDNIPTISKSLARPPMAEEIEMVEKDIESLRHRMSQLEGAMSQLLSILHIQVGINF